MVKDKLNIAFNIRVSRLESQVFGGYRFWFLLRQFVVNCLPFAVERNCFTDGMEHQRAYSVIHSLINRETDTDIEPLHVREQLSLCKM